MSIDIVHETPDGKIAARIKDRWFVADNIVRTPDGQDLLRVDDRWFLASDLVAA